jgi:hypothetical protein
MKTIKAWAVVDKDGNICFSVCAHWGAGRAEIYDHEFTAKNFANNGNRKGERVVRVTITVEDE